MQALSPNQPDDDSTAHTPDGTPDAESAADLIRQKLDRIYGEEPDAKQELAEAEGTQHHSRHQQFMQDLSNSGKDLATIQTEWHNYYQGLPDNEKHEVWQEFYSSHSLAQGQPLPAASTAQQITEQKQLAISRPKRTKAKAVAAKAKAAKLRESPTTAEIQKTIRDKVNAGGKLETKHHVQSLLFGLSMGLIAVIIFLFGFFNEVVIAPFIQPSRASAATPLILSTDSVAPTSTPEVIIPKINVEIPVNYTENSTDENAIENDLQDGVVHYPTTVLPGQQGNTAFFGHSSNNIFNGGKYKFAFVLLHTLVPGDTFYLTYNSKVYVYKVISRTIVDPSDVGVLGPVPNQTATATLITCDPPGTSLHRLIVVGQQISPDPSTDVAGTTTATSGPGATALPGNGPTLWSKYIRTAMGKLTTIVVLIVAFVLIFRWMNAPLRRKRMAT